MKKLLAILLAVCLLAGCAAAPTETSVETTTEEPAQTTEETTPETTEETTQGTTEPEPRQYVYAEGVTCYHIPVVEMPGVNADEINETLYETYTAFLQAEVLSTPVENRFWLGLTYEVGRKGDAVSVTVLQQGDCDLDTYEVYYFSATTGELLTKDAVFAACDMTPEEGTEAIRQAMETYWEQFPMQDDPFVEELKEKTLADSNVSVVKPLITETGELQFVGEFYSPAGADSYWHRFDPQGEFIEMSCCEHG